jgi:hypothetical protein
VPLDDFSSCSTVDILVCYGGALPLHPTDAQASSSSYIMSLDNRALAQSYRIRSPRRYSDLNNQ